MNNQQNNTPIAVMEEAEGYIYRVVFTTSKESRSGPYGRRCPVATQCVIFKDNRVLGYGEVIKHHKEKESPRHGRLYSAKKAFAAAKHQLWGDDLNKKLWDKILKIKD